MLKSNDLLHSYLASLQQLTGATALSLFIPRAPQGLSRPLLVHEGETDGIPELATPDAADEFDNAQRRGDLEEARKEQSSPRGAQPVCSAREDAHLIPIWTNPARARRSPTGAGDRKANKKRRRLDGSVTETRVESVAAWLGLKLPSGVALAEATGHADSTTEQRERAALWGQLLTMGGALVKQLSQVEAILRDPVTGLPDRAGLQSLLAEDFNSESERDQPLSLLLINPDDFAAVNERFGREAGDKIIQEVTESLQSLLRSTDPVFRYGGVIFAVLLDEVDVAAARAVSEKILRVLSEPAYLDGAVRLVFSIGIAILESQGSSVQHPLDLIRRADQALNAAKRQGGGTLVVWEKSLALEESGNFDRLSGIYTGNRAKDYRNMALLRDLIDVMALHDDFPDLATQVVEKLFSTFKPDRVGLLQQNDDGELQLVKGLTREPTQESGRAFSETLELSEQEHDLVLEIMDTHEPRALEQEHLASTPEVDRRSGFVVPLLASGECFGGLLVEGRSNNLTLEPSDLIFLRALCSQLAVALDRARLTELERHRRDLEKQRLLTELKTLRQAVQQAKMVYRSPQMESLVNLARRVARTDATVLLSGPSGTGKELMARTIHELSPRKGKPFVIVDLSAIATSLLESELFGHEKGAFTGAQQRREGRLAQADGGTVLLDEINVLSLEVQGKLLRFVQEKQLTMVGGTRTRRVDVRIIATTNRDLRNEVQAGRFREDLYHRLNVVRIDLPPLRERPEDILHLSRHFLETFAVQHHKNAQTLTPEAQQLLLRHEWEGNVRELQNRILRAVILSDEDIIGPEELGLPADAEHPGAQFDPTPAAPPALAPRSPAGSDPATTLPPQPASPQWPSATPPASAASSNVGAIDPNALREALSRQVDRASNGPTGPVAPLGKWLSDDLVLAADRAVSGVARQGSALMGIPVSTYRRRRQRASELSAAGLSPRSASWEEVRRLLGAFVRSGQAPGSSLLRHAEQILLQEILKRFPEDERRGSALLGVTPLTFRRRVSELTSTRQGEGRQTDEVSRPRFSAGEPVRHH